MGMSRRDAVLKAWITRRMRSGGTTTPKSGSSTPRLTRGRYSGMARKPFASLGTRTRIIGGSLRVARRLLGRAALSPRWGRS